MAKQLILLVAAFTLLACAGGAATGTEYSSPAVATANTTEETTTVYGMLVRKGFPVGVLPQGVQCYRLFPNGSFDVNLPGRCRIDVPGGRYTLHYGVVVAGRIRDRQMSGLDGLMMKEAPASAEEGGFAWRTVERVTRSLDGDRIKFSIYGGRITRKLATEHFLVSPDCV